MSGAGYAAAGEGAFQIWAGFQQAEMIRENGQLQQKINDLNAGFADLDAINAEQQGYTEAARYKEVVDSTVATQRVGYAAQGVDVNSGTAKEVQEESKLTGFLNTLGIEKQAREKALGYKNEARNIRLGGAFQRTQTALNASSAQISGLTGAANTAINGYARS